MMYDEPSRGIDVKAKQQIFQIMWEQSRKGISSIFVSSELEELVEVCHRILIMHMGKNRWGSVSGRPCDHRCIIRVLYGRKGRMKSVKIDSLHMELFSGKKQDLIWTTD